MRGHRSGIGTLYPVTVAADNRCRSEVGNGHRCVRPVHPADQPHYRLDSQRRTTALEFWSRYTYASDNAEVGDVFESTGNVDGQRCNTLIGGGDSPLTVCNRLRLHTGQHVAVQRRAVVTERRTYRDCVVVVAVAPQQPAGGYTAPLTVDNSDSPPENNHEFRQWIVAKLEDEARRRGWCSDFDDFLARNGLEQYRAPRTKRVEVRFLLEVGANATEEQIANTLVLRYVDQRITPSISIIEVQ